MIPKKTRILITSGVLVLSAVTAFWTLSEKTLSNHECFVSITAREMLADGNWIMPTCNGELRLQKTPLSYWLVAGVAKITGRVSGTPFGPLSPNGNPEFTARLPSAVFAVFLVGLIIYYVSRWLTFRIAIMAALIWVTSLGCIKYAHSARPEMALTFFVALCFFAFYSAVTAGVPKRHLSRLGCPAKTRKTQIIQASIFWISFGLANLAKGPAPLPLVILPLFFYVAIFRHWKILPKLLPIAGPLIFLAIALPWPVAVAYKMNWDLTLWKREFVDRFFGSYSPGDYPFYYYLLIMFKYIAPWVVFLPMALAAPFYRVWNTKQGARGPHFAKKREMGAPPQRVMKFLWLWFVVDMVFLTINGCKRQHYMLPLMPAMAVLIGILIEDMVFVRKAYTVKYAIDTLRNHLVVIIAGAVAVPVYIAVTNPELLGEAAILSAAIMLVAVSAAVLFSKRKPALGCGAVFVGFVVLVMISYVSFVNPLDPGRYSRDFARKIAKIIPQSDRLIAYEYISPRSVQYFGRAISVTKDTAVLYEHYNQGCWVVATAARLEKLKKDDRFRRVYYEEKAKCKRRQTGAAALFHKSADVVEND